MSMQEQKKKKFQIQSIMHKFQYYQILKDTQMISLINYKNIHKKIMIKMNLFFVAKLLCHYKSFNKLLKKINRYNKKWKKI